VSVVISSVFGVCKDDTSLPVPGLSNVSRDLSRDHDPFFESREDHSLIGVANIFLEALFYDVQLQYHVPIISQQGEVTSVCLSVCLCVSDRARCWLTAFHSAFKCVTSCIIVVLVLTIQLLFIIIILSLSSVL